MIDNYRNFAHNNALRLTDPVVATSDLRRYAIGKLKHENRSSRKI
jgi:hypothetical protein